MRIKDPAEKSVGSPSRRSALRTGAGALLATLLGSRRGVGQGVQQPLPLAGVDAYAPGAAQAVRTSAGLPGGLGNPYRFALPPPLGLAEQALPPGKEQQLLDSLGEPQRQQLKDKGIQLLQGRSAWDGARRVLVVDPAVTPQSFPLEAGFQAAMVFNADSGLPLREAGATHRLLPPARMGERLCSPGESSARYAWVLPEDRVRLPRSRLLMVNTSAFFSYWDPTRCLIALSDHMPRTQVRAEFDRCVRESRSQAGETSTLPPLVRAGDVELPPASVQALKELRRRLASDARVSPSTTVLLEAAALVGGQKPSYDLRENLLVLTVRASSELSAQRDQLEGLLYGLIGVEEQSFRVLDRGGSVRPLPSYPLGNLSPLAMT